MSWKSGLAGCDGTSFPPPIMPTFSVSSGTQGRVFNSYMQQFTDARTVGALCCRKAARSRRVVWWSPAVLGGFCSRQDTCRDLGPDCAIQSKEKVSGSQRACEPLPCRGVVLKPSCCCLHRPSGKASGRREATAICPRPRSPLTARDQVASGLG